jgi:uncharacterized membrane protein
MLVLIILRLVHIVSGVIWVGSAVLMAGVILPAARSVGGASQSLMKELMRPSRLPAAMGLAALLTALSGIGLFARIYGASWMTSHAGVALATGGLAAIAAAVVGPALGRPTGRRLAVLAAEVNRAGGRPSLEQEAELERLSTRTVVAARAVAALLLFAASAMATARYL